MSFIREIYWWLRIERVPLHARPNLERPAVSCLDFLQARTPDTRALQREVARRPGLPPAAGRRAPRSDATTTRDAGGLPMRGWPPPTSSNNPDISRFILCRAPPSGRSKASAGIALHPRVCVLKGPVPGHTIVGFYSCSRRCFSSTCQLQLPSDGKHGASPRRFLWEASALEV